MWLCIMYVLPCTRAAVKAVVERLITMAFVTTMRSLFDRDKPVYSLLIALEVSISSLFVYFGLCLNVVSGI